VKFLNCMEQSLSAVCGPEVAAWQRIMTSKMMMTMSKWCVYELHGFRKLLQIANLVQNVGANLPSPIPHPPQETRQTSKSVDVNPRPMYIACTMQVTSS